jgi:hypothetical protein
MLRVLLLTLLIPITTCSTAFASPNDLGKARRSIELIKREERSLTRTIKRLSGTEREKLKSTTKGLDSDGDRVPDLIEGAIGSNRCDADSDDDGVDDNTDPNERNGDSDDDGVSDGNEVETKGRIQSFRDPILVVGTTTLTITDSTVFFRGLSSKDDLQVNTCVEAESHKIGLALVVQKIKRHTGAECSSGGDAGGDDSSGDDDKGRR